MTEVVEMELVKTEYYSNIQPKSIEWLWYPYIPYGKLTIIQGDPGEGKSTFILNIIALITQGKLMPDGYGNSESKVAIYQCAEDSVADTIKPRLEQAGANCDNAAFIVDDNESLTLDDVRIEAAIEKTGARLFVIDPIQAFIPPDADMLSATKMRNVLRKLANVADRNNCAIILIGHMNKGHRGNNLYRGLGSIDIAAIARSILMITRDVAKPGIRYMIPIKSSLAPEGSAISFIFKPEGGIQWLGKCDVTAGQIQDDDKAAMLSKHDRARQLIINMLSMNPVSAKTMYEELDNNGIKSRTVEKVKKELQVTTYRSGKCWYWKLPNRIPDIYDNSDGETDE